MAGWVNWTLWDLHTGRESIFGVHQNTPNLPVRGTGIVLLRLLERPTRELCLQTSVATEGMPTSVPQGAPTALSMGEEAIQALLCCPISLASLEPSAWRKVLWAAVVRPLQF